MDSSNQMNHVNSGHNEKKFPIHPDFHPCPDFFLFLFFKPKSLWTKGGKCPYNVELISVDSFIKFSINVSNP
jgi:hypothetical protein